MDQEFLKQWRASGKQELAAQIAPDSLNEENRTVDVLWFTGADVERFSWMEGPYMLRFDPKGADLSLLNQGAPLCDNHRMTGCEDQKGVVERAWAEKGEYKATLRFKRSTATTGPRPDVDGLWQDIKDKIVTKFSMGVEILESTEKRDKGSNKLQMLTATKWRPFELSLAPIPADYSTTTLSAAPEAIPASTPNGPSAQKETAMETTQLTAAGDPNPKPPTPPTPPPPPTPDPAIALAAQQADMAAQIKQAIELERTRVSTIRERLSVAKLPTADAATLEKELVDGGISIELASGKIFEAMAKVSASQPETRTGLAVQRGNVEAQVETLAREIANRDGVSMHKATVTVINANPKLYDQYLAAHPEQTGARA